jgi:nucleoid DNA-binding protein
MIDDNLRDLTRQKLEREIAKRSRSRRHTFTEEQVHQVLGLFFDILYETLTQVNGNVTLEELGYFEAWRKKGGGKIKIGNSNEDMSVTYSYQIRFRPALRLKQVLKEHGRTLELALKRQAGERVNPKK